MYELKYFIIEKNVNTYSLVGKTSTYSSLIDLIIFEIFRFCKCGSSIEIVKIVRDILNIINENTLNVSGDNNNHIYHILIPNEGVRYLIYSWLSQNDYVENGSSQNAWVTEKGIELLYLCKLAIGEYDILKNIK